MVVFRFGATGLSFVTSLFLARLLTIESYGAYYFMMSALSLLAMPSGLGLPSIVTREVAASLGRGDWSGIKGILRYSYGLSAAASLLVVSLALAISWLLGWEPPGGCMMLLAVVLLLFFFHTKRVDSSHTDGITTNREKPSARDRTVAGLRNRFGVPLDLGCRDSGSGSYLRIAGVGDSWCIPPRRGAAGIQFFSTPSRLEACMASLRSAPLVGSWPSPNAAYWVVHD